MSTAILPHLSEAPSAPAYASPEAALVRVGAVVSALSHALDLSTGQPEGHSVRTCVIGMRIAEELGLNAETRSDLFYALLLKDCGCSSNASKTFHALGSDDLKAKRDVKTTDWTRTSWETMQYALSHVAPGKPFLERARALLKLAANQKRHAKDVTKIRCERGYTLAQLMGLSDATANGILNLDEHWDGKGYPEQMRRTEIPILSRIMLLAQTLEYFHAAQGAGAAMEVAQARSNRWFDPDLVRVTQLLHKRKKLWQDLDAADLFEKNLGLEPNSKTTRQSDHMLDSICIAFAQIVDAKSPFTFNHSNGVANAAVAIALAMGLKREQIVFIRHAALLHDLGKLNVSNAILEKPGKLDETEWQSMRQHPFYTWKVLSGVPGFDRMAVIAAAHHEKLNGKGYWQGLTAEHLPLEARILAVADIFDALSADRPYRAGMPMEKVFGILRSDAPHALDAGCVDALERSGVASNQAFVDLQILNDRLASYEG